MNRLSRQNNFENTPSTLVENFFAAFNIAALLRAANVCKERGFPGVIIFQSLFELVFSNRTMFMAQKTMDSLKIRKDAFYRFVNSVSINWIRFMSQFAAKIIPILEKLPEDNMFVIESLNEVSIG